MILIRISFRFGTNWIKILMSTVFLQDFQGLLECYYLFLPKNVIIRRDEMFVQQYGSKIHNFKPKFNKFYLIDTSELQVAAFAVDNWNVCTLNIQITKHHRKTLKYVIFNKINKMCLLLICLPKVSHSPLSRAHNKCFFKKLSSFLGRPCPKAPFFETNNKHNITANWDIINRDIEFIFTWWWLVEKWLMNIWLNTGDYIFISLVGTT